MDEFPPASNDRRFWLIEGDFGTCEEAFAAAESFIGWRCSVDRIQPVTAIGDFVIPPVDGLASRDFQTLHVDFGLPLDPQITQDIARYTALYIARSDVDVSAITRLVPLVPLAQRAWPDRAELIDQICRLRSDPWGQG